MSFGHIMRQVPLRCDNQQYQMCYRQKDKGGGHLLKKLSRTHRADICGGTQSSALLSVTHNDEDERQVAWPPHVQGPRKWCAIRSPLDQNIRVVISPQGKFLLISGDKKNDYHIHGRRGCGLWSSEGNHRISRGQIRRLTVCKQISLCVFFYNGMCVADLF